MLETINDFPWYKFEHAYGSASDTPGNIRKLASASASDRETAFENLCVSIYHQGSVYEASIFAVPFLVELLRSNRVQDKDQILYLLYLLANGGSWHANHYDLLPLMKDRRDTPEYQDKMRTELEWVGRLKLVLNENAPAYFEMLESVDIKDRLYAVHLLLALPDQKSRALVEFKKRVVSEPDPVVRAYYYFAIGARADPDEIGIFLEAFNSESHQIPRLAATIALVSRQGKTAPAAALQLLVETLLRADDSLTNQYALPDRDLITDIATAITCAGRAAVSEVLPRFTEQVRKSPRIERCWALLFMAFCADGKPDMALVRANLSNDQKQAIIAVCECAWRNNRIIFGNAVDILRSFDLPDRPEDMDKLLGLPNEHHSSFASLFPKITKKPWWKIW